MASEPMDKKKCEVVPTTASFPQADDKRILVIDDEQVMLESCSKILQKDGYAVETFDNGQEGIARFKQAPPPVLIVDLKMPDIDGMQVIQQVREIDSEAIIVVITGYATVSAAVEAMKAGAYDFLPKPFTPDELRLIIRRGYERWNLARESKRLRREKDEIERNFVTLVSHQLRSPLAAVRQCLDALEFVTKNCVSEESATFIYRAQARTDELLATIKDWLTLSKLKRGVKCDDNASVDLADVIRQVAQSYEQRAESEGVELRQDVALELPRVCGDNACIGVLVGNLVSNAIKYNHRGGFVEIATGRRNNAVEVKVIDSGMGIPAQCLPHLFKEFYRVKNEKTGTITGSGLGLTICKAIVDELGGSLEVSNNEKEGCTFTVLLPAKKAEREGA